MSAPFKKHFLKDMHQRSEQTSPSSLPSLLPSFLPLSSTAVNFQARLFLSFLPRSLIIELVEAFVRRVGGGSAQTAHARDIACRAIREVLESAEARFQ